MPLVLLLAGAWLTAGCEPTDVETLMVNSTLDDVDAAPGDGVCQTSTPGRCTLRAAVMEANANLGADTIVLQPATVYTLTIAGTTEDAAATGDLDLTEQVTICLLYTSPSPRD